MISKSYGSVLGILVKKNEMSKFRFFCSNKKNSTF